MEIHIQCLEEFQSRWKASLQDVQDLEKVAKNRQAANDPRNIGFYLSKLDLRCTSRTGYKRINTVRLKVLKNRLVCQEDEPFIEKS